METGFLRSRNVSSEDRKRFYQVAEKQSLLGRIGSSEDIANLTSFLASDDARNITGSIYVSDSGALINPNYALAFKPDMYKQEWSLTRW